MEILSRQEKEKLANPSITKANYLSVITDAPNVNSLSELSSPSYIILTRFFRHGMIIVIELALSSVEC